MKKSILLIGCLIGSMSLFASQNDDPNMNQPVKYRKIVERWTDAEHRAGICSDWQRYSPKVDTLEVSRSTVDSSNEETIIFCLKIDFGQPLMPIRELNPNARYERVEKEMVEYALKYKEAKTWARCMQELMAGRKFEDPNPELEDQYRKFEDPKK